MKEYESNMGRLMILIVALFGCAAILYVYNGWITPPTYHWPAPGIPCGINNPLMITTSQSLPDGTEGTPYTSQVVAKGGAPPYNWSIAAGNLPSGLTLNTTTGIISGKPKNSGIFYVELRAGDEFCNDVVMAPASIQVMRR